MKTIKKMKTTRLLALLFISVLTFSSCQKDDHDDDDHDHENELITTLIYTLTSATDTVTLTFRDLDGEGGAEGTYEVSGSLTANTPYSGAVTLLNETEDPAENVTEEIEEEAEEHEFFYSSTLLDVAKTDLDANGNPIGLTTTLIPGAPGSASLTIVLKHEPTKPNDGTVSNAGGSTDIEVTFNVNVQ